MFQNKTRLASMLSQDIPQLIPQDVPVPSQDVLKPISTDALNFEFEQTISKFDLKVFIYVIAAHPIQFTYSRRFSPWFLIHYLFANLIFSSSYSSDFIDDEVIVQEDEHALQNYYYQVSL